MTPKKMYLFLVAVTALLSLSILGGAYGVKSLLQTKSEQLVSLRAQQASYSEQQVGLTRANKDIAEYSELYSIAKSIVPENKNQAEAVRQIVKLAADNSVSLGSISFPSSTLGSTPGSAATGANSLSPAPKVNDSAAALSQLTPVVGSPGVYVMPITVSSNTQQPSTYPQLINFLADMERNRLTAEVTTISILPAAGSSSRLSFTLTVNTYIKPWI